MSPAIVEFLKQQRHGLAGDGIFASSDLARLRQQIGGEIGRRAPINNVRAIGWLRAQQSYVGCRRDQLDEPTACAACRVLRRPVSGLACRRSRPSAQVLFQ